MNITVTTAEGLKIVGPADEVKRLLGEKNFESTIDTNYWYLSSSKGLIPIRSMASQHIKNAMLVHYQKWINELRGTENPGEFVRKLVEGPADKVMLGLLKELDRRNKLGGHTWSHSGYKF